MAVNAAARRETEEKQGMVAAVSDLQTKPVTVSQGMAAVVGNLQIRPLTERQGMVISVSDLQKRPVMETEENNEVKRVKINPTDTKQQMENIVDEEWRRMALSIEKQTRAIRLKTEDAIEMKVGEFDSDLKRTIINKPSSESKPTMSGNVSGSKVIIDSHQKKITVSENTSRAKQDQATEKPQGLKRRRWDDEEHRERKCDDDDKRLRQKQSPSSRSARTPPRSYRSKVSPPRPRQTGRSIWSLKDDKAGKYPTAIKNADQKASTQSRGDVIIVDDDQPKVSSSAKGADKSAVLKPTSSSQQTTTTSTATTAASSASSFKFSWKAKTAKPPLIQYGPRPGSKAPAKGMVIYLPVVDSVILKSIWHVYVFFSLLLIYTQLYLMLEIDQ